MDMLIDSGSGDAAEVRSEIESVRIVELPEGPLRFGGESQYLSVLPISQFFNGFGVFVRHHHQMTAVVGVKIQDDE